MSSGLLSQRLWRTRCVSKRSDVVSVLGLNIWIDNWSSDCGAANGCAADESSQHQETWRFIPQGCVRSPRSKSQSRKLSLYCDSDACISVRSWSFIMWTMDFLYLQCVLIEEETADLRLPPVSESPALFLCLWPLALQLCILRRLPLLSGRFLLDWMNTVKLTLAWMSVHFVSSGENQ